MISRTSDLVFKIPEGPQTAKAGKANVLCVRLVLFIVVDSREHENVDRPAELKQLFISCKCSLNRQLSRRCRNGQTLHPKDRNNRSPASRGRRSQKLEDIRTQMGSISINIKPQHLELIKPTVCMCVCVCVDAPSLSSPRVDSLLLPSTTAEAAAVSLTTAV